MKNSPILLSLSLLIFVAASSCKDDINVVSPTGDPDLSLQEDLNLDAGLPGRDLFASKDATNAQDQALEDLMDQEPDLVEIIVNPNAIFVSMTGLDSNKGRSLEAPFRTLTKAASIAVAGETIYVEAGNYGNENVVFENEGEMDSPITLEGYQHTPGDRPTYKNFDENTTMDPSLMPLLNGGDRGQGVAVTMFGPYLITRNIQIQNYARGIYGYGADHSEVHHAYLSTFGENKEDVYSGKGIIFGTEATYNLVQDSVVIDAGAEGIGALGQHNRIDRCTVIGTSKEGNNNSTDYYIYVDGTENIIEHSHVKRIGVQVHVGHGIGLKGNCENNIIRNNFAEGFTGGSFYARHRGVRNNLYKDNRAINGEMGMNFRDGASANIVEGFTTDNVDWPLIFLDTDEDGKTFSGKNNIIRGCLFENTGIAIVSFHDYLYDDVFAESNLIEDCVFDGSPHLFDVRSMGRGNLLRNSTMKNIANYARFENGHSEVDIGFTFENIVQENNGFVLP